MWPRIVTTHRRVRIVAPGVAGRVPGGRRLPQTGLVERDGDGLADGLGAAQARAQREQERRAYELKDATFRVLDALRARGLTGVSIVRETVRMGMPLSRSVVAKLTSDGDVSGWRPPSPQTCRTVDALCRACGIQSELARRREALDHAAAALQNARAVDRAADTARNLSYAQRDAVQSELRDFLTASSRVLSRTAPWLPYRRLDSGFAERFVKVSDQAPTPDPDSGLYQVVPPRGTVRWDRAVEGLRIAVVLADAGYGKTWQLRRHYLRLCEQAHSALDRGAALADIPLPLWVAAADLACCWAAGGEGPAAAVITAAASEPRRAGVTMGSGLASFLADRLATGVTHVLIDAYDEVFDDSLRFALKQALGWLTDRDRVPGARIILASRRAGYDQPFDVRAGAPEEGDGDEPPPTDCPWYLYLGPLEEAQIRNMWADWFSERGSAVPEDRLEPAVAPNSPLRRFVGVPLVAAFCAWVAERETVSFTRTGLYGQVLNRFLAQVWKPDPAPGSGSLRQDGARRARLEGALTELAWVMATEDGRWCDAVDVRRCEQVLMAYGPAAPAGRSHTWEPLRQVGILVQPDGGEDVPGEGPVLWIHRSVQQYLAARKLIQLGPDVNAVVMGVWLHPAWGDVLDFAIGLEAGTAGDDAVTRAMHAHAAGPDDPLGWYSAVSAAASAGLPAGRAARGAVLERVWRLHRAGLLSPVHVARVLALVPGADPEAVVRALAGRLESPAADRKEVWRALAWTGKPGRMLLAGLVRESPEAVGAAAALYATDPRAAVAALRDRVAEDLPLGGADARVLRELDEHAVGLLAERYEAEPESDERADWLGLTRHSLAREVLSAPEWLRHATAQIRFAAAYGLAGWYGTDIDRDGLEILLGIALHDPLPELRRRIRSRLQSIAEDVPWVEASLDEVFDELYQDPTQPEISDRESLAVALREVGPATHKAVAMLIVEPRLIDGPVREALLDLLLRALRGELEPELTADVARAVIERFGVTTFAEPACSVLREADADPLAVARVAIGLAWAVPGDREVFEVLATCAGSHPHPLTEAVLHTYDLPLAMKCDVLGRALLALTSARPVAVEVWSGALRSLLEKATQHDRRQFRGLCAAATEHLLQLPQER
jgi:hypothetical protein